jgi:integrase
MATLPTEQNYPVAVATALARYGARAAGAYADNTMRAHRADWGVWSRWCEEHNLAVFPCGIDQVESFLLDCIAGGRKRSTLSRYMATFRKVHEAAEVPCPLDSRDGKLMWRAILRDERLSKRQKQAVGMTWDDVQKILAHLDASVPKDARDAALVCLAYETQLRMSELVALQWSDLSERLPDGSARVMLERSKTDQEGEGRWLYVSPHTLGWLERWRAAAEIETGPILRSCPRSNRPGRFAKALGTRDVPRIFKRLSMSSGLDVGKAVSGHSMRVGKAQDLLAADATMPEIMRAGRWKSTTMPARYTEMLEEGRGGAARLAKLQGRLSGPDD